MIDPKETDLAIPATPEDVATVLRAAAAQYREAQSELQAAWQDKNAGRPWGRIATVLEVAAGRVEKIVSEA